MRTFALSLLLSASPLYAMAEGSVAKVQLLKEAELVSVTTSLPQCPVGQICEPRSVARLRFVLPGCLDELGPVHVKQSPSKKARIRLDIEAYAKINPESKNVMCLAPNTANYDVILGLEVQGKSDVELVIAQESSNSP